MKGKTNVGCETENKDLFEKEGEKGKKKEEQKYPISEDNPKNNF